MTGASVLETWVKQSVAPVQRISVPIHFQEVQHDQGPTGSLELHYMGGEGVGKVRDIPDRLCLEKH